MYVSYTTVAQITHSRLKDKTVLRCLWFSTANLQHW